MRTKGMWRPADDDPTSIPHSKPGGVVGLSHPVGGIEQATRGERSGYPSPHIGSGSPRRIGHPMMQMECPSRIPVKNSGGCHVPNCGSNSRGDLRRPPKEIISYRELDEQERFPGLDKDSARTTLHNSSLNLSQHIYSEPSFDNIPSSSAQAGKTGQSPKGKKFSFTFWK